MFLIDHPSLYRPRYNIEHKGTKQLFGKTYKPAPASIKRQKNPLLNDEDSRLQRIDECVPSGPPYVIHDHCCASGVLFGPLLE
jgi:hypothetical protein